MFENIKKLTNNKFLNLFQIDARDKNGKDFKYFFASRGSENNLECITKKNNPDGIMIYAVLKDNPSKIVVVKQYRYPINDYIYEMPAGLIDENEKGDICAIREFKEETGMNLDIISNNVLTDKPFYTSVGLTDESVIIYYGYAYGEISKDFLENTERIETFIIDKEEAKRILKEEKVAMKCALLLIQFINSDEKYPFNFLNF